MTTSIPEQNFSDPNRDNALKSGNNLHYAEELEALRSKEVGPEQTLAIALEIIGKKGDSLELAHGHTARCRKKLTNPAGWAPDYVGEENLATVYVPTVGTRTLVTNPNILGASGEPKLGVLNAVIRNTARLLRDSARPDHDTFESKRTKGGLNTASADLLAELELTVLQDAVGRFIGDESLPNEAAVNSFAAWAKCDAETVAAFMNTLSSRIAEKVLPTVGSLTAEGVH